MKHDKARIPSLLWLALIALGLILLRQALTFRNADPMYLFGPALTGFLLYSAATGRSWTPALAVFYTAAGFLYVWLDKHNLLLGVRVGVADLIVLFPILAVRDFFERGVEVDEEAPTVIHGGAGSAEDSDENSDGGS